MFTRKPTPTIAAIFVLVCVCSVAYAVPVHIYGRGNFNRPIPADRHNSKGQMDEATIEIIDNFTIVDLDVAVSIEHTNVFDLQLFIESPSKTRICLNMYDFKRQFFKGQGYHQTIFDDEAAVGIEAGRAPFNGRFRPKAINAENLLSVFDGENLAGVWKLQVYDSFYYDTGTLKSFKMLVTIPEPASAILLIIGAGSAFLTNSKRS